MNELDYVQAPACLDAILARTQQLNFAMASEPRTGAFLRALVASKAAGRFLELGTGTGVATAWLLHGMDSASRLLSIDVDPDAQAIARELLGADSRLTLILEDGIAFLRRQTPQSFDLVFADAMPGKYESLKEALALVKSGGLYVIDDLLPQPNWPEGHAEKVPALLKQLASDPRFILCPMAWASGVAVAVRKA
jgi:predicted O-methyltransferase YrrM